MQQSMLPFIVNMHIPWFDGLDGAAWIVYEVVVVVSVKCKNWFIADNDIIQTTLEGIHKEIFLPPEMYFGVLQSKINMNVWAQKWWVSAL